MDQEVRQEVDRLRDRLDQSISNLHEKVNGVERSTVREVAEVRLNVERRITEIAGDMKYIKEKMEGMPSRSLVRALISMLTVIMLGVAVGLAEIIMEGKITP